MSVPFIPMNLLCLMLSEQYQLIENSSILQSHGGFSLVLGKLHSLLCEELMLITGKKRKKFCCVLGTEKEDGKFTVSSH